MKQFNKQILEAILKGINLALDDIEDQSSDIQVLSHGLIKSKNYTKEYLEASKYCVDLGLPSGTLWFKYNLGVKPNVIIKNPGSIYGNYYAWGEVTSRKRKYSWDNYKHAKAQYNIITKYITNSEWLDSEQEHPDNLNQLLPEDDAVTQMFNGNKHYHIPTYKLFEELFTYTNSYYRHNYLGCEGLNGVLHISKINGNDIFFPCAGYKNTESTYKGFPTEVGKLGRYWSANLFLYDNRDAHIYSIAKNGLKTQTSRHYGLSIRPVYN